MNKKGITVIEIVISIGLISVVMLFLFNLLIDMQFEDAHSNFAKDNQLNRGTIIKTVQEDFLDLTLRDVAVSGSGSSRRITFTFYNAPTTKTLDVYEDSITYNGERWNIEDDFYFDLEHIVKITSTSDKYRFFKVVIPVINNLEDANVIDDIEFFFVGTL